MAKPRRYFNVNIFYTTGGFHSKVKLDAKIDKMNDGTPITTPELARLYTETYLIFKGEKKYCNVY